MGVYSGLNSWAEVSVEVPFALHKPTRIEPPTYGLWYLGAKECGPGDGYSTHTHQCEPTKCLVSPSWLQRKVIILCLFPDGKFDLNNGHGFLVAFRVWSTRFGDLSVHDEVGRKPS